MAKTYPAKVIREDHPSTPRLTMGAASVLLPLLKAALVNGIGEIAAPRVSYDTVKALVRAEFNVPHYFKSGDVLSIKNSQNAAYNTEVRVVEATISDLWFDIGTDTLPEENMATFKLAPLGWSLTFENTEKTIAIFKPNSISCEVQLRVDNSQFSGWKPNSALPSFAKVQMVTDVVSIDDYVLLGETKWFNSCGTTYESASPVKKFVIIGTDQFVYFLPQINSNYQDTGQQIFNTESAGVFESNVKQDTLNFLLGGSEYTGTATNVPRGGSSLHRSFDTNSCIMAGDYLRNRAATSWSRLGAGSFPNKLLGSLNKIDNSLSFDLGKVGIMEGSNTIRGYLPLLVTPLCQAFDYVNKVITIESREVLSLYAFCGVSTYYLAANSIYIVTCGYDVTPEGE